jgi:general stress protein 26
VGKRNHGNNYQRRPEMAIDEKEILTGDDALVKLRNLLAEFPIAFMVTIADADVTARPIGIVGDEEFNGTLWFITDKRSRKVAAIESGATTTLLFQNDKNGNYLQLTGRASVVEDRARLERLYTTLQRTWFPKGLDDPDITLVRFDADGGNYWDGHDSYLRLGIAFAKSIVTGEPGKSGNAGIARL